MTDELPRSHDVFISHSSRNSAQAMAVCAGLEQQGLTCWIAPRNLVAGLEYEPGLVEAIRQTRIVLLIFSNDANRSPQVAKEMNTAFQFGRPILPFCIETAEMNDGLLYQIGSVHRLYALTPPIEQYVPALAASIRVLLLSLAGQAQRAADRQAPSRSHASVPPPGPTATDSHWQQDVRNGPTSPGTDIPFAPLVKKRARRGAFVVGTLAICAFAAVIWGATNRSRTELPSVHGTALGSTRDSAVTTPRLNGAGESHIPIPPTRDSDVVVQRPTAPATPSRSDSGHTVRKPVDPAPAAKATRAPATDSLTCLRLLERQSLGALLSASEYRQLGNCRAR